jgi:hypothetical protein
MYYMNITQYIPSTGTHFTLHVRLTWYCEITELLEATPNFL